MDVLITSKLRRVEAVLEQMPQLLDPMEQASPTIHARLVTIVQSETEVLNQRLSEFAQGQGDGSSTELDAIGKAADKLAAEVIALVGGGVFRNEGIDNGLCDLADRMLASLTTSLRLPSAPPSLPAPGEYVDMLSDVIRVRFPGGSVWDLPIAVHELGHFAASKLKPDRRSGTSVDDIIAGERAEKRFLGYFADELFADTFATFVAGPAYAYTCMTTRFSPQSAYDDDPPTHPKTANRVLAIMAALDVMNAVQPEQSQARTVMNIVLDDLREFWAGALDAWGQPAGPTEQDRAYVDRLVPAFLDILAHEFPVARFGNLPRAMEISAVLGSAGHQGVRLEPGDSLLTILNAGWLARRRAEIENRESRVAATTDEVRKLCALTM